MTLTGWPWICLCRYHKAKQKCEPFICATPLCKSLRWFMSLVLCLLNVMCTWGYSGLCKRMFLWEVFYLNDGSRAMQHYFIVAYGHVRISSHCLDDIYIHLSTTSWCLMTSRVEVWYMHFFKRILSSWQLRLDALKASLNLLYIVFNCSFLILLLPTPFSFWMPFVFLQYNHDTKCMLIWVYICLEAKRQF